MRGRAIAISASSSPPGSRRARSPFTAGFIEGPRSDSDARLSSFFATFPQLPRGYADGPLDALEYLVHVAGAVHGDHAHASLAVVVQDRLRELVILVHPLGDRLPRVVGTPLDCRSMANPVDDRVLRDFQGDHEVHPMALLTQHLVQRSGLLERAGKAVEQHV